MQHWVANPISNSCGITVVPTDAQGNDPAKTTKVTLIKYGRRNFHHCDPRLNAVSGV